MVLATNDPDYYDQYTEVVEFAGSFNFEIVNPVNKRIFPWNYTRADFDEYKSYFQAAKATNCRVFIIA